MTSDNTIPAALLTFALSALSGLLPGLAQGVSDDQYQRIRELGMLNGVALHCRYLEDTHRMKEALVRTLPKRREYGMAFDMSTNDSFLRYMELDQSCPNKTLFSESVDRGIRALEQAFSEGKN